MSDALPAWPWLVRAPLFLKPLAPFMGMVAPLAIIVLLARRAARQDLLAQHRSLSDLQRLDWAGFERLVGEAYRLQGWTVTETGQGGADGGVDLELRRRGTRAIVQVKHWQARVGAPIVREMFGLMVHHKVERVAIVALGGFTKGAREFARGKPVDLVDGPGLLAMTGNVLPDLTPPPDADPDLTSVAPPKRVRRPPRHESPSVCCARPPSSSACASTMGRHFGAAPDFPCATARAP